MNAAPTVSGLAWRTYSSEQATVVECTGQLTIEHTDKLKAYVRGLIPSAKIMVLDLKGIGRIDSAGLGALVALYVAAKKVHCEFLLENYNQSIRKLLGLSNLLSVFESCARSGMRIP
jgi:anti-anti-sigma factor